jgi:acyl carrier protein
MTEEELVIKLGEIFKSRFMISTDVEVHAESRLGDDLKFDSLDTIEVGMVIEEEFGVIIADGEWANIGKMITLARHVKEKL